jgi:prevent-host-death family protein
MTAFATVNIGNAKAHFSQLLKRVAAGEEIVIARAGRPIARLVRYRPKRGNRKFGTMRGKIIVAPDFDAPLPPEIQRYFDGEDDEPM